MQTGVDAPVPTGTRQKKVAQAIPGFPAGLVSDRRTVPFYERTLPKLGRRGRDPASFALHLGFWDAATSGRTEAVENENRSLARLAAIERGDRVLDAGCGSGASALWLAGELGARVVGIDLAPSQVVEARRRARAFSDDRLAAALSGLLQFEALGRGLWSYGLFTATKGTEGRENTGLEGGSA